MNILEVFLKDRSLNLETFYFDNFDLLNENKLTLAIRNKSQGVNFLLN